MAAQIIVNCSGMECKMKKAIFTSKKSFTLLEIIVVMIIMAGGAAIAMPRIGGAIERMKAKEGEMILLAILKAERPR